MGSLLTGPLHSGTTLHEFGAKLRSSCAVSGRVIERPPSREGEVDSLTSICSSKNPCLREAPSPQATLRGVAEEQNTNGAGDARHVPGLGEAENRR